MIFVTVQERGGLLPAVRHSPKQIFNLSSICSEIFDALIDFLEQEGKFWKVIRCAAEEDHSLSDDAQTPAQHTTPP